MLIQKGNLNHIEWVYWNNNIANKSKYVEDWKNSGSIRKFGTSVICKPTSWVKMLIFDHKNQICNSLISQKKKKKKKTQQKK